MFDLKVRPFLKKEQLLVLDSVKIILDSTGNNNYNINSNSSDRKIHISSNLIKWLVRYSVAEVIGSDIASFGVSPRFSLYYVETYPFLPPGAAPEDAAALSDKQKKILEYYCSDVNFQWLIEKKLFFLYLHELRHQFQNYTDQVDKFQHLPPDMLKERLLGLETDADQFAIDILARMDFVPDDFSSVLNFFMIVRERQFFTVEDVAYRQANIMRYLQFGLNCKQAPKDSLCIRFEAREKDYLRLYGFYHSLHNPKHLAQIERDAFKTKDINGLYNLGDFFLKGSSAHIDNLEKAIRYYEAGADMVLDTRLKAAKDIKRFLECKEYCCGLLASVYQYIKLKKTLSIKYYRKASEIGLMFPPIYYQRIVASIF